MRLLFRRTKPRPRNNKQESTMLHPDQERVTTAARGHRNCTARADRRRNWGIREEDTHPRSGGSPSSSRAREAGCFRRAFPVISLGFWRRRWPRCGGEAGRGVWWLPRVYGMERPRVWLVSPPRPVVFAAYDSGSRRVFSIFFFKSSPL